MTKTPTPPNPTRSKAKRKPTKKPKVKAVTTKKEEHNDVAEKTVNQALQGLGYIFNIVASGTWTPNDLNVALAATGLGVDANLKVRERSWLNAIQMAAKRTNGENKHGEPFKVEQLHRDAEFMTIAYYERAREFDSTKKVKLGKYTMLAKATFDFVADGWLSNPQELLDVGFFSRVNRYKKHLFGGDLRYHIFNPLFALMKCTASIGGAKFVVAEEKLYPRMIDFCKSTGISYRSYTQMADAETKKALAEDVRGTLSQTLENIKLKVSDILGKKKPRRDGVENAKKQLGQCRVELDMMAKLLGFKMQDVQDEISALEQAMDGVKITEKTTRKTEYKAIIEGLLITDFEIAPGCYVIPAEQALGAGLRLPKKEGAALIASVAKAIAELGYLGGYHGSNLVLKQLSATEVSF